LEEEICKKKIFPAKIQKKLRKNKERDQPNQLPTSNFFPMTLKIYSTYSSLHSLPSASALSKLLSQEKYFLAQQKILFSLLTFHAPLQFAQNYLFFQRKLTNHPLNKILFFLSLHI